MQSLGLHGPIRKKIQSQPKMPVPTEQAKISKLFFISVSLKRLDSFAYRWIKLFEV